AILDPLLSAKSVEEVAEGASFRPLQEIVEEADYFRCYRALYREASPAGIDVRQQPIGPLEALSVVHCAKALEWVLDSSCHGKTRCPERVESPPGRCVRPWRTPSSVPMRQGSRRVELSPIWPRSSIGSA